jgi:hypothetical protein
VNLSTLPFKMICPTATCAGNFKPRSTILAEDGIGEILSPPLRAVHIITQLAIKSFKLLGREKRCRTEQSVLTLFRGYESELRGKVLAG